MSAVKVKLVTVLRDHLKYLKAGEELDFEQTLGDLGLDSMSAIDLLFGLEEAFEVSFPDALLNEETFRTARSLENAVCSLLADGAA